VSTTNTSATTQYQIYRTVWNASTQTYAEVGHYLGTTTSTSYTDASPPFSITSSLGASPPADVCLTSFTSLSIRAYNQGATNNSNVVFFQGPNDGPGGGACTSAARDRALQQHAADARDPEHRGEAGGSHVEWKSACKGDLY